MFGGWRETGTALYKTTTARLWHRNRAGNESYSEGSLPSELRVRLRLSLAPRLLHHCRKVRNQAGKSVEPRSGSALLASLHGVLGKESLKGG